MAQAHEGNVLITYRSLRVAMIPLLLILVVATLFETLRGQVCVLGSISAYFHTPVRGAFVFALAGLGACLIAYKGNDAVEDVLLNFAGFMAFLVALVPTTVDPACTAKYGNIVADANTAEAVRNNVLTLFIVSVVALVLYLLMPTLVAATRRRNGLAMAQPVPVAPSEDAKKVARLARILALVTGGVVLIELAMFGLWPNVFTDVAHGISAITMVLGVLGVMVANARGFARATQAPGDSPAKPWINRYAVAAATTLVLIGLAILLTHSGPYLILVVELIVIGGFVIFWLMQTRELWDYPSREEKSQKVDEVLESLQRGQEPRPDEVEASLTTPPPVSFVRTATASEPEVAAPVARSLSRRDVFKAL